MADASTPRRTRNVQAGPRSQAVIDRVRAATLVELEQAGYAGMTMNGVARAAGINRTTLYRRWPDKAALLGDLLESEIARLEQPDLPPGLAEALDLVLKGLADNLARPEGLALARTFTAVDPQLQALAGAARQRALARMRAPFAAAQQRGELAADADIDMLAHMLFAGATLWAFHEGGLSAPIRQRLAALVLRAAGAKDNTRPR